VQLERARERPEKPVAGGRCHGFVPRGNVESCKHAHDHVITRWRKSATRSHKPGKHAGVARSRPGFKRGGNLLVAKTLVMQSSFAIVP
jgi:hypothetical protein